MFNELISFWQMVRATYVEKEINKVMYWYLTICIVVVGGLYMYLYYQGCIAFSIIFSSVIGADTGGATISIVQAIGIILILKYVLFGGVEALIKAKPVKLEERLNAIESKVGELHRLAFEEIEEEESGMDAKRKRKAVRV